jgi:two-component system, chemotaxis family, protein-glutamate methylesterase/glutaminase
MLSEVAMERSPVTWPLVVIGASRGGIEALQELVAGLPADLPAAVCVVQHLLPDQPSQLPRILSRAGPLPAVHPLDGQPIIPGHIYVAPPDQHLVVTPGRLSLTSGPRENRSRPAVDTLFRSAAHYYGTRVVGVVLTGALDDGSAGLVAVQRAGGIGVVQDPHDAVWPDMPQSAIAAASPQHVLPLADIATCIDELARRPIEDGLFVVPPIPNAEPEMHNPLVFGCPECGGPLVEGRDGQEVGLRCKVGHAYAPQALLAAQREQVEGALWTAIRALDERASLADRLHHQAIKNGWAATAPRFANQAVDARTQADLIRQYLVGGESRVQAAD